MVSEPDKRPAIRSAQDARAALLAVRDFALIQKAAAIQRGADSAAHSWDEVKAFARDGAKCITPPSGKHMTAVDLRLRRVVARGGSR